jgi:hypothetical protein
MAEKVLASNKRVQLIVFFGAIREILKKEIYGGDKENFRSDENKSRVPVTGGMIIESRKFGAFGLWIHFYVNGGVMREAMSLLMKEFVPNIRPELFHDIEGGIKRNLLRPFVCGICQ